MSVLLRYLAPLRARASLRVAFADLLSKRWTEAAVPLLVMVVVAAGFGLSVPGFLSIGSVSSMLRELAEFGLVAMAMLVVVMSGGIDLSVGAIYALCNLVALLLFHLVGLPVGAVVALVVLAGAVLGAANGALIGVFKARAFLTTLVTLIIYRSIVKLLRADYALALLRSRSVDPAWDWLGKGELGGIPPNVLFVALIAGVGHVLLSRSRPGWHLTAIGSGRRSARQAGIPVERTLFWTYVVSGALCALAAVFYAARQNAADSFIGVDMEISVLTAIVLGGVSLGGGRGSVGRALLGSATVLMLSNGLVRMGLLGSINSLALGAVLLVAVGVDAKWAKNRHKAIREVYVVPGYLDLGPCPPTRRGCGSPFEVNDRLQEAEGIGVDLIDGPEDVILDRQDRLYGGTRQGWIMRLSGPDFSKREIFARPGGRPLGMTFDKDDNLIVCIGGMGVYGFRSDGTQFKVTDSTNRSWTRIVDDSRLRLADDLDIAPDGKIWFSEATIRYEMSTWMVDALEARGNGRIVCHDPATGTTRTVIADLHFPNGVCVAHDGRSILFALTWSCKVMRYWIEGPRAGELETVIHSLPGHPDNINRASDGTYWLAIVGMRTPTYDLAMRKPGFRRKMVKRLGPDEWLYPNINSGCVVKFDESGSVLESLWDPSGQKHPMVSSMREHKGYLYLGGISNNRIGRIKIPGADPSWNGLESYWGKRGGA